ncbi:Hypothetical predicted protein, partial [Marmota monax]
ESSCRPRHIEGAGSSRRRNHFRRSHRPPGCCLVEEEPETREQRLWRWWRSEV